MADTIRLRLPGEPPPGFLYRLGEDLVWQLVPDDLGPTLYKIMVGNREHCGYFNRADAERFLPEYQANFPGERCRIEEEAR